DFGIARIKEVEGLLETDSLKTQIGQVLGTPRYMSPEQALGEEIDGRSDLFSVGVILYELTTGKKAFAGGSAATLALQITQQEPEAIANLAPESPRGLQFIISKLLAKKRERRFPDGGQLTAALKRELSVYETVKAEAAASRQRYLPLQVRLTLILGAITALVLAGSIGAVLVRQYRAMEQMAITAGSAITTFVGANSALPAAERDWAPVAAFVKVASDDPNVQDMVVADADGMVQAASDPSKIGHPYEAPKDGKAVGAAKDITISSVRTAKGEAFQFVKPITFSGRTVGKVDLSFSKSELESAAMLTRFLLSMLGVVVLGVILIATYALTRMLAQPITRLKEAFAEAARGNFDFRISHSRNDEFGELFEGFNRLAAHVQERFDAVEAVALDRTVLPAGGEPDEEPVVQAVADPNSPFATPAAAAAAEPELEPDPLPALGPVPELDDPLPDLGEPGPDAAADPLPHFGDEPLPALGDTPVDEEKTVAATPTVEPETTAPHSLGAIVLEEDAEGEYERTVIRKPRGEPRDD
ncbi:MAG: HAMP domain-containing protein, partial [Caulobacteraceae bacterium]